MYNNYDTDQVKMYDNRNTEARSFEQVSNQNGRVASEKTSSDDTKKKEQYDQESDHRFESGQTVNVSPATIEHYLKGMKYPADKSTLLDQARSNDAPKDVIYILDQFEDKEYNGVTEVNKEIGRVEKNKASNSSEKNTEQRGREASQKNYMNGSKDGDKDQERRQDATNVSPATIEHYLKGMKYPADKDTLVERAKSNDAPKDVIYILDQFEDKEYNGVTEVNKEIGRVEKNKASNPSEQNTEQREREVSRKGYANGSKDGKKDQERNSQETDASRSSQSEARRPSSSQGHKQDTTNVSPATIEHYLKGMKYPADKDTLVERAKSNNAPRDVLHILQEFEKREYNSVIDVSKEIGRIENNRI